ncbi:aspartate/glutamate racemase family protein [Kaistella palustris]|uniref:aspartate/glutamate racemase family protein n=1 Tax=Kaistella palustris TaxID=493376 RepID=UPI0004189C94|nr:aspartate/glutamate racemase family protein [Kaistella palustris]
MSSELPLRGVLGLGAVSTQYYLQRIHKKYQKRHLEFSTCPLMMYQIDFQEINPYLPRQFDVLLPRLKNVLQAVENIGISKLIIPNITLHEALDQIETSLSVCHPVNLTLNFLREKNIPEIILFGTKFTMRSGWFKQKFTFNDIEIILPSDEDQQWLDSFRKTVYTGQTTTSDIEYFQNLIRKYGQERTVVLACTELSVYSLKQETFCIDIAELQIEDFLKE